MFNFRKKKEREVIGVRKSIIVPEPIWHTDYTLEKIIDRVWFLLEAEIEINEPVSLKEAATTIKENEENREQLKYWLVELEHFIMSYSYGGVSFPLGIDIVVGEHIIKVSKNPWSYKHPGYICINEYEIHRVKVSPRNIYEILEAKKELTALICYGEL